MICAHFWALLERKWHSGVSTKAATQMLYVCAVLRMEVL
jgi:hypothetical protein